MQAFPLGVRSTKLRRELFEFVLSLLRDGAPVDIVDGAVKGIEVDGIAALCLSPGTSSFRAKHEESCYRTTANQFSSGIDADSV